MGDSYWKYPSVDNRPQQQPPLINKRPRTDYDSGGRDLPGYFIREDDRGTPTHLVVKDSDTIGASYDRYLRVSQLAPYGGIESARPISTGLGGRLHEDPRLMAMGLGGVDSAVAAATKVRDAALIGGRNEIPLPSDASNTLFVEGLPSNCSRREVAHIFRPFVGYREVRLVTKESRHARSSGDPLVLCFVDFESPAEAATAKDALQGYKFDEHDRDSVSLRIQFARYPGARTGGAVKSGGGSRGRR